MGAMKHCSSTIYYYFTLFQEEFLVSYDAFAPPNVNIASPVKGPEGVVGPALRFHLEAQLKGNALTRIHGGEKHHFVVWAKKPRGHTPR
jgi:hypothetical protein